MNHLPDDRSAVSVAGLAPPGKHQPDHVTLGEGAIQKQSRSALAEVGQLPFQRLASAQIIDQNLPSALPSIENARTLDVHLGSFSSARPGPDRASSLRASTIPPRVKRKSENKPRPSSRQESNRILLHSRLKGQALARPAVGECLMP
jgi:hypothetical protein